MYVREDFIMAPNGDVTFTWTEDSQEIANDVRAMRENGKGWVEGRDARISMSIPVAEYHKWGRQLGYECWKDKDFQKFYKKHRPEFVI